MAVPAEHSEALHRKTIVGEMSDMIRERLLETLEQREENSIDVGELSFLAWESENVDGAVFYANYEADLFVMRHLAWVDDALAYACQNFGDAVHYANMKAECSDRFLVVAFICATDHYLFSQLDLDANEVVSTKERTDELVELIKAVEYDGGLG
jgi:hypothetical protein